MSAPKFVNTTDGTCWTRREATRGGLALYAPEGVCNCPEFVMATEVELAELGIVGTADVLPVPVGPVLRSELDQAHDDVVGACLARWESEQENERLRWALASAKRGRARLRAEVAELNEALSDAAEALRARPSCPCPPEIPPAPYQVGCFFDGVPVSPPSERPVDGLTARYMPVASLREVSSREEPHDSPLHHPYRIPHDLPDGCCLTAEQVQELGNPYLGGGV